MTRLSRVGWVRFPHSPATARLLACAAVVAGALVGPAPLPAQVADTVPVIPGSGLDIPARSPISPRSAFFRSLLIPGYGQISLDRSIAAGVFAFVEVGALGMARRSLLNLRDARTAPDSVVDFYVRDPATGRLILDEEGRPVPGAWRQHALRGLIPARRTHYEDWVAVLIFNHLFSAADAYVAAHLWDFPATISASVSPDREARVRATIRW